MSAHGRATIACVLAVGLTVTPLAGQGVRVQSLSGEIGADFDGRDLSYANETSNGYGRFREWVLLRAEGSILTPGLLDFDVRLRPMIGQRYWTGLSDSPSGNLKSLDGGARATLLARRPLSLSADILSIDETEDLAFGGEQNYDLRTWGARLDARWTLIPMKLEYRERHLDRIIRSSPENLSHRQDSYRRLRFEARNQKTNLSLEQFNFDDRIGSADFDQFLGRFDHNFRWGTGSDLNSQLTYVDRTGSGARKTVSWRQGGMIKHPSTFASEFNYNLFDGRYPADFSRGWGADYRLRWDPTGRSRIWLEGYTQSESFRAGSRAYTRIRPGAEITFGKERRQLRLAATTGYEWHSQATSETDGTGTVSGERHQVDQTRRFLLDRPFPEPSTVVVRSADGTITYVAGFDYELLPDPPFVEVVVLPGGDLGPGATLRVDYQYSILPGGEANALTYSVDATLSLGPFSIYHRRAQQAQLGGGPPAPIPTLLEYDNSATGLQLSGATPVGALSVRAEYTQRSSRTFSNEGFSVGGTWTFLATRDLRGRAFGSWWNRTNGVRFEMLQAETTLEWRVHSNLRLLGRLSGYDWNESDGRREQFLGAGLGFEWRLRQLIVSARYDRKSWDLSNSRVEDRILARISREF